MTVGDLRKVDMTKLGKLVENRRAEIGRDALSSWESFIAASPLMMAPDRIGIANVMKARRK